MAAARGQVRRAGSFTVLLALVEELSARAEHQESVGAANQLPDARLHRLKSEGCLDSRAAASVAGMASVSGHPNGLAKAEEAMTPEASNRNGASDGMATSAGGAAMSMEGGADSGEGADGYVLGTHAPGVPALCQLSLHGGGSLTALAAWQQASKRRSFRQSLVVRPAWCVGCCDAVFCSFPCALPVCLARKRRKKPGSRNSGEKGKGLRHFSLKGTWWHVLTLGPRKALLASALSELATARKQRTAGC